MYLLKRIQSNLILSKKNHLKFNLYNAIVLIIVLFFEPRRVIYIRAQQSMLLLVVTLCYSITFNYPVRKPWHT